MNKQSHKRNYFEVIECDNDRAYAYWRYAIKWNVNRIIKEANETNNGYIVQKVSIKNEAHIEGVRTITYFEAWRVHDGVVEYQDEYAENQDEYKYDDLFGVKHKLKYYDEIEECLDNCIGRCCEVCYHSEVYWVDRSNPIYCSIDGWLHGGVTEAGDLKSILASNFHELDDIQPLFFREPFVHRIDFTNSEIIFHSIENLLDSGLRRKDSYDIKLIKRVLKDTNYSFLIERFEKKYYF